jgi:hypothetical protein
MKGTLNMKTKNASKVKIAPGALYAETRLALEALDETARIAVWTAAAVQQQSVPVLRTGTAEAGALAWGSQVGTRRLKAGEVMVLLAEFGAEIDGEREAWVGYQVGDESRAELLLLRRWLVEVERTAEGGLEQR